MSKNHNNRNSVGSNLSAVTKPTSGKGFWPETLPAVTDTIAKHPVVSGILGAGALASIGGGIYLSHDAMRHNYDAEIGILKIFSVKLTKKQ